MKGFIYKVIRKSDGAIYIGKQSMWQTKDPSLSPSDIMGVKYFTSSKLIKDDWKKNPDAYSFEVLEENITDDAVLSATEVLFITKAWEDEKKGGPAVLNQYCNERFHRSGPFSEETRKKISDACKGREGTPHSEESKRKISEARKRNWCSEEYRAKLSEALRGRDVSDETRKRLSESLKGRKVWNKGKHFSEEEKQKMFAHRIGKPLSDETKKKISEAHKGKPLSAETRKKMSEARKGIVLSEETRKRMSEAQKGHACPFKGKPRSDEVKKRISESCKKRERDSEGRFIKNPKEEA